MAIRAVERRDIAGMKAVILANELFEPDLLDDMLAEYFHPGQTSQCWLIDDEDGAVGLAYYAPERMTSGTWNLYLIAIHPQRRRQGRGAALLHKVEQALALQNERVLLVETSSLPGFAGARDFYRRAGFDEEARIREFYAAGEDKIVFRKALAVM